MTGICSNHSGERAPFLHRSAVRGLLALSLGIALMTASPHAEAQEGIAIPAPVVDLPSGGNTLEVAVLAGGCFWGVQGVFQHVDGVLNAVSGYAGGEARMARYEIVVTGATGHAESVQVTFDPRKISYGQILQIFFSVAHDPTQLNRQGPDIGTHYRSAIFPLNSQQAEVARAYISQLNRARVFDAAIVTRIEANQTFYRAEDYHQDYMTLNPTQPYIVINDLPKVGNLRRLFPEIYRADPILTTEASVGS